MKRFGKVVVLYGGTNAEREVSLSSGRGVLEALQKAGVDAHGVDVGPHVVSDLQKGGFDRAFIILHGRGGEDGTMQALLEFLKIPYCGSGVAASSLAMDKVRAKWVWQANQLPTPDFMPIYSEADLKVAAERIGFPMCIKPVHEGSSCGVSKVLRQEDLVAAYQRAKHFKDVVVSERWIEGDEYTVSIVADQVLPSIHVTTPTRDFYDYDAKYIDHSTVYDCPSGLSPADETAIQQLAMKAYQALGCKGWGRVDVMRDRAGQFWLLEVNTLPGMTPTSLVPKAAKVAGMSYQDVAVKILETSLA